MATLNIFQEEIPMVAFEPLKGHSQRSIFKLWWLMNHISMPLLGFLVCRTSHGLQFFSSCFSCALWLGRNLVGLFCIRRKGFSPALFYIHTRKNPQKSEFQVYSNFLWAKNKYEISLKEKKFCCELYFYTSVFRSCTPLNLLDVQGSTVSAVMPITYGILHICSPLDLNLWYCCFKVLMFHSTWMSLPPGCGVAGKCKC